MSTNETETIFAGVLGNPFDGLTITGLHGSVVAVEANMIALRRSDQDWWAVPVTPVDAELQPEAGEAGFLICTGSPTDGFSFHGPFADDEGAKSWAEGEADDNWWMVSVGAVQA